MNQTITGSVASSDATTLSDALQFLRRRFWVCAAVGTAILAVAVLVAFRLPPVYLSRSTILIEQPAIPEDIVSSTISSYVDEQIQIVAQRVYTPDSVMEIVDEFDLYPEERKIEDEAMIVDRFISETELENLTADVTDERGRSMASTFAFIVGFRHNKPETAQAVAATLADRFLEENVQSRRDRAATTTDFLEQEAERLAAEISEMETKVAQFKDQYGDALPDKVNYSMTVLDRTEDEISQTQQELRQLRADRQIIQAEMSSLDPYATIYSGSSGDQVFSSDQRLAELRQQYLEYSARYGPEHPDVVRTRREIEAIVGSGGVDGALGSVAEQRAALEAQRDSLLDRYSPEHPDVVRLERALEALPESGGRSNATSGRRSGSATNPAYLQAQARLQSVVTGIDSAERRLSELRARRDRLESNVAVAPRIEQEWLQLSRGYESLQQEYDEIKRRSTAARLSENLEVQNKGERFTLLKRAGLPSSPVEPNRPAIIFLGAVLALGCGIGLAALIDAMDSSVRGAQDLVASTGQKPLVSIPYVQTIHDRRIAWTRRIATTMSAVVLIGVIVSLV